MKKEAHKVRKGIQKKKKKKEKKYLPFQGTGTFHKERNPK
jgi:hypothetical protein